MNLKAQSLIAKVAAKGIITPFEALNIQYLCRKQMLDDAHSKSNINNQYSEIMEMQSQVSGLTLVFQTGDESWLYSLYYWTYSMLVYFDITSSDFGHKGLVFIYELNRVYEQYTSQFKTLKELQIASYQELQDQKFFSMICQQDKTYNDLTIEFVKNYHNLVNIIDNVLTLNYYLQELIEIPDLDCLKHFTRLFLKDVDSTKNMFQLTAFDLPYMCYELLGVMLEDNHHNFIEYMKHKVYEKGFNLRDDFEARSLTYVKAVIEQHMETAGIKDISIQASSIKTEKSE